MAGNLWLLLSGCLLCSLFISLLLARSVFTVVGISGYSMYPTLQDGDRLLVIRYRSSHKYQTGQIIVTHPPYNGPWQEKLYVKRLIGLPGNQVTIHSSALNEQIHSTQADKQDDQGNITWQIPEDHCFVRGESSWSEDSLVWGPIPLHCLVGVVLLRLPHRTPASIPPPPTVRTLTPVPPNFAPVDKER